MGRSAEAAPRRLRAYPEYRDAGIEWLGTVPSHWHTFRLRFVVETNSTKEDVRHLDPHTEVSFLPMEAVHEYGGIDLSSVKPLADVIDGYTYFRNGDVILAKITPCFENGKGALARGLCGGIGFGTTELHVLRPSFDLNARFLLYLTFSDHFRRIGTASMYGAGGQKRISDDFVPQFSTPHTEPRGTACHRSIPRPRNGKNRRLGGTKGALDRAAPGETRRPHHPCRYAWPRSERPHEGLRRRVARRDSSALGTPPPKTYLPGDHRRCRSQSFLLRADRRRSFLVRKRHTRGPHSGDPRETHERSRQPIPSQVPSSCWRSGVRARWSPRSDCCCPAPSFKVPTVRLFS